MSVYIPVADRAKHANKRQIKGTSINYPTGRKSKSNPDGKPPEYLKHQIIQRMKQLQGQPNKTRDQRTIIKEANPHHFIFGEARAVWKTYQTYAQNMGLLETDYEQD